ncbi:MAG: TAXI family TRAP transporter solute-binding subunit [Candidatus Accumulibacter sp.]|jgi:TRAP transporter TAXI family solute receptor|nr:TAXI family TRAP transporter solute-binding subunit [Accumulibacter sp.]
MKLRQLFISAACCAAASLSGAAGAADVFVRVSTSSVGGGFYLIGNTIAQLGQSKMPGVNFTAITGGSIKNLMNLEKGDNELGLTQSSTLAMGIAGTDNFKTPLKNVRYVTSIYPMPAHILVSTSPAIKSVAELKGQHVDYGPVGGGIEVNVRELLSMYGMTAKDVQVERFGRAEFEEAYKTGRAQGTLWTTTLPNAQVSDLIRNKVARLIGMSGDELQKMLTRYPHYISTTIPAGTYDGQTEDVRTFGAVGSLLTHKDVPEELIYNITKMLHENSDFLKERLGTYFANFNLKFALEGMGKTELHPGAAKYYREKGLIK